MATNNAANFATGASGTVLQGAGVGTAPTFSTATYPSTTTINQILYSSSANTIGGISTAIDGVLITSHTGVPSILANGTAGYLLTANSGAPPSWQAAPASSPLTTKGDIYTYSTTNAALAIGSNFQVLNADSTATTGNAWVYPNTGQFAVIEHFEDFIGSTSTAASIGSFTFRQILTGGAAQADNGTGDHPGIYQVNTSSSTTGAAMIISSPLALLFGGGVMTLEAVIQIPVLSAVGDRFTVRVGFGDAGSAGGAITDGAWFQYSDNVNSGNWQMITSDNTTQTTASSATAVTALWTRLKIECNAAGNSVAFYVNGTQVTNSPITTHIPTGAGRNFGVFMDILKSAGSTQCNLEGDFFYLRNVLTNPR